MVFAKSTEYALKSMAYMAQRPVGKFYGVRELADRLELSTSYLSKILQQLARKGYLTSSTGPGGGFSLAMEAEKIHVMDIFRAVDDGDRLDGCILGWAECGDRNPCPFHAKWKGFKEELKERMTGLSVRDVGRDFWPGFRGKKTKESHRG